MGIGHKERNFEKYLEKHFEIKLPEGVEIFYAKGIRIGNTDLMKSHLHGDLGYAACDFGFNPTNSMIQNFGHLARKNVIKVEEKDAKEFASGKDMIKELGTKSKFVIVRYGSHIIGLGHYDPKRKRILNKMPEKRRRDIVNSI
ncbi:MAG: hypothetical protein ABII22_01040 [Candidatus Micrarchaeota archaeon]